MRVFGESSAKLRYLILEVVVGAMFCVAGGAIESNGDSQLTTFHSPRA